MLLWLCAGLIVVIAFVGHQVDGSADELIGGDAPVIVVLSWLAAAILAGVAITRRVQQLIRIDVGPGLAMTYDALPLLLLVSWPIAVGALLDRRLLLGALGVALCLQHLWMLVPRVRSHQVPDWVEDAPTLDLVVANVFVHNKTPDLAATQLVESGADVIIINESTARFLDAFDRAGGDTAYPFRISDPTDLSEYAITVASRLPFDEEAGMHDVDRLRMATAGVRVEGTPVQVIATHLSATLEAGGLALWKEQVCSLNDLVPTLQGAAFIAGDLNMTRYRPEFAHLLTMGLLDAIDAVGAGLSRSLKIAATGPLGAIGPIARLDHVITTHDVFSLSARNLHACGSDHLPLFVRLAVRPR